MDRTNSCGVRFQIEDGGAVALQEIEVVRVDLVEPSAANRARRAPHQRVDLARLTVSAENSRELIIIVPAVVGDLLLPQTSIGFDPIVPLRSWPPFETVSYTHLTLPTIYSV